MADTTARMSRYNRSHEQIRQLAMADTTVRNRKSAS